MSGAALAAVVVGAPAQTSALEASEAQQAQRQQEREQALRRGIETAPEHRPTSPVREPQPRLPDNEASCFVIQEVRLDELVVEDGQPRHRPADRYGSVSDALDGPEGDDAPTGRCIGAEGIDILARRLERGLIDRGWVTTRVVVGEQDLSHGQLSLVIVPGRLRRVRFSDDSSPRGTALNAVPIKPGELLQLQDIEQGLDNLKRVPTAEADIEIVPVEGEGAEPGLSDLVVHYQQRLPLRASLSVDDGGTEATGKVQGTATVSYDHWWTLNDLFYLSVGHDLGGGDGGPHDGRGTRNTTLHYSVPFGWWLFSATASHNRYHQSVPGAYQTYIYSGRSETQELKASRVVFRDAHGKTTLGLRAFRRASSNFIDDTEVEVQRRVTAGWEASLAHRQVVGDTVLDANLAFKRGTGAFGSMEAPEEAFGEGTSHMQLATGDFGVSKPFDLLGLRWRASSTWHGQWNRTPLSPQDRLAIGGRYTVRGFDGESSLMAERGWFCRNELGVPIGAGQEAYLGVDAGRLGGASVPMLLGRTLAGTAVGLRGQWQGLSYDIFAGAPLHKPDGFRTAGTTVGFNASYSW